MERIAHAYCMHTVGDWDEPHLAIEFQKNSCENYYTAHLWKRGFAWGGIFIDCPASSQTPLVDRAAGGEMIDRAEQGDHLVFSSLTVSYFRRCDLVQLAEVARGKQIALHFVDEAVPVVGPDATKAVSNMLHALERIEDLPRRRAIREALARRQQRGLPKNGETPIGRKLVGTGAKRRVVDDPEELAQMQQIYEWRMQGIVFEEIYRLMRRKKIMYSRRKNGRMRQCEWSLSRIQRADILWRQMLHEAEMSAVWGASN